MPIPKLFIFISLFFLGCTKMDSLMIPEKQTDTIDKFFATSSDISMPVRRVLESVYKRNEEVEFVKKFAKDFGYPRWDKALKQNSLNAYESNSITGYNLNSVESDSIYYIPFVLEGQEKVNGFIKATIKDSIYLNFSLAEDYKYYEFTQSSVIKTANNFAFQMILLNREVFGDEKYLITDPRLFSGATSGKKTNTITLKTPSTLGNRNSNTCWTLLLESSYCTTPTHENCVNQCDECGYPVCWRVTEYQTECPLPGPTGGGGPTTGGTLSDGGGTGSGEIPHELPCDPGPVNSNVNSIEGDPLPPCPPLGPGTGWIPIDPSYTYQQQMDLMWMESHTQDSTNSVCVAGVLNTLKQLDTALPSLIKNFFDTSNIGFHVVLKMANNGSGEGASTLPQTPSDSFSVTINSFFTNATDLAIASTIIHEYFHCQLLSWFRHAIILNDTALQNRLAAEYGYLFSKEIINIDSSFQYIVNGGQALHHQDIATRYNSMIGYALHSFATKKGYNVSLSYCKDLAWAGSFDSRAYQELSQSVQDRIAFRVNAEKDPNGSSINPLGNPYIGTKCL